MDPSNDNGWAKHKLYVTSKLESLDEKVDILNEKMNKVQVQLATLKVRSSMRSGMIGALTGSIPSITIIIWLLAKGG